MKTRIYITEENGKMHYQMEGKSYEAAGALIRALARALAMVMLMAKEPGTTNEELADAARETLLEEIRRESHENS